MSPFGTHSPDLAGDRAHSTWQVPVHFVRHVSGFDFRTRSCMKQVAKGWRLVAEKRMQVYVRRRHSNKK